MGLLKASKRKVFCFINSQLLYLLRPARASLKTDIYWCSSEFRNIAMLLRSLQLDNDEQLRFTPGDVTGYLSEATPGRF